jgi:RND family efflux transporter MFP subunit
MNERLSRWILGVAILALAAGGLYWIASSRFHNEPPPPSPIVQTVHPKRADLAHKLDTNATLEAFESADLYPKVSGYLSSVNVDIGDHVKAGQVLAVISIPELEKELAEAKAQLEAKRADLGLEEVTLKRQQTLFKARGITEQAFDEAKSKMAVASAQVELAAATAEKIKTMLGYTQIVAPFDGVLARRQVNRGDFVQSASGGRTTPLFTVQRIDTIRVFCEVPESDVARLHVGDSATVRPYGLDGKALIGTVARVALRLDPETRNMRTEIDLPNADDTLYPGMYAQVTLETNKHPNVLTIPAAAVGADQTGKFVYVVQEGKIGRLPIKTGLNEGGLVEIVDGLTEGADVVASAKGAPAPGTAVRTSDGAP